MKKIIYILFAIGILCCSCKTTSYQFVETIEDSTKNEILQNISYPFDNSNDLNIECIFSEKNINYKIKISLNKSNNEMLVSLYSTLTNELQFHAKVTKNESWIFDRNNVFSYPVSKQICSILYYTFDFTNAITNIYLTKNDITVLEDNENNYYRYENNRIEKKQNNSFCSQYEYDENGKIERILLSNKTQKAYLIIQ